MKRHEDYSYKIIHIDNLPAPLEIGEPVIVDGKRYKLIDFGFASKTVIDGRYLACLERWPIDKA